MSSLLVRGRVFLIIVGSLCCCQCGSTSSPPDAGGPPAPEERFGNDRALVARFAELKACSFEAGRLDYSCTPLQKLHQQLDRAWDDPERRTRLITTLRNLLDSRTELSRLVAATALSPARGDATVQATLRAALHKETSEPVSAALLRELCWTPRADVLRTALALLSKRRAAETLRLEAASCLGRGKADPEVVRSLRGTLRQEASTMVRAAACAALGDLHVQEAVPDMAAQLGTRDVDWRCASALAALGSEGAYQALRRGVLDGIAAGRLSAQTISALLAFTDRPFFERAPALELLARIAADGRLGEATRQQAAAELARLGGKPLP